MELPRVKNVGPTRRMTPVSSSTPIAELRAKQSERGFETRQAIADAASESAMWGGVAQISQATVGAATDVYQTFQNNETKKQLSDFELSQLERATEWNRVNGSKTEYLSSEVPVEVRTSLGIPDTQDVIAGYLVKPAMKRAYQQRGAQEDSALITDETARQGAIQWARGEEAKAYGNSVAQSVQDQPRYITAKTVEKAEAHRNSKEFDQAIAVWDSATGSIPQSVIDTEQRKIMREKQDFHLTNVVSLPLVNPKTGKINEDTILQTQHILDLVKERDPEITGALTDSQVRMHRNALEGQLKAAKNMVNSQKESGMALTRDLGRKQMALLKDGVTSVLPQAEKTAKMIASTGKPSDIILANNIRLSARTADVGQTINQGNILQMRGSLLAIENQIAQGGSTNQLTVLNGIKKNIETTIEQIDTNPVNFVREHQIAPVMPFTKDSVVPFIQNRNGLEKVIDDKYNRSGEFMDDNEYGEFSSHVDSLSVREKTKLMGDIFTGFEGHVDRMNSFFEPMKGLGLNPAFVAAAQRFAMGKTDVAEAIMGGADMRAQPNGNDLVSAVRTDLKQLMNTDVGAAYQYNPDEQGVASEAILNIYAYLSKGVPDVQNKPDKDRLQQAADMYTGGMINLNGSKFAAPTRNLNSTEKVDDFIEDLTPDYYRGLAPAYSAADVDARVKNGEIQLTAMGQNKFALHVLASDTYVPNEFGDIYNFSFHAPDATLSTLSAEDAAARQAERRAVEIAKREKYFSASGRSGLTAGVDYTPAKEAAAWVMEQATDIGQWWEKNVLSGREKKPSDVVKEAVGSAYDFYKETTDEGKRKARAK